MRFSKEPGVALYFVMIGVNIAGQIQKSTDLGVGMDHAPSR
jgi:hypothetical protein